MNHPDRPNGRPTPQTGEDAPAGAERARRQPGQYEIFGPFELPLRASDAALEVSPQAHKRFWSEINERETGLGEAYGCYVFSVRGRGWRHELPWYVGRADRRPFQASCLAPARLALYAEILEQVPHAGASLYLLSRMTRTGRFSKPPPGTLPEIGFVQSLLAGAALGHNSRLRLDPGQAGALSIPGLLAPQGWRLTIDARALRSVLGL